MAWNVSALVASHQFGSVTRKAVALILAEHSDGESWSTVVGQARVASEAEVSERTVRTVLAEFEAEGLIRRVHRARKGDGNRGGRTSDRIWLVAETIAKLPEAVSGNYPTQPANGDTLQPTQPATGATQPATGADPNGKAIAGEPEVDPSVEPPASAAAAESFPQATGFDGRKRTVLAVAWARVWADLRGQTWTPIVEKAYTPQVEEFLKAGGEPSVELLRHALGEGIKTPNGWAFVATHRPVPAVTVDPATCTHPVPHGFDTDLDGGELRFCRVCGVTLDPETAHA